MKRTSKLYKNLTIDLPDARKSKVGQDDFLAPHAEELFRVYIVDMGTARSYRRLREYAISKGYVNRRGYLYRTSLWKAVWRWATKAENFEKAYEYYSQALRDEGKFMTKDEFKQFLLPRVSNAHQHINDNQLKRFLKRNDYTLPANSNA